MGKTSVSDAELPMPKRADRKTSLREARRGFQTQLVRKKSSGEPVPEPPAGVLRIVKFDSPVGQLAAYISPDPKDGKKRPAIIWITGGDCNTIGEVWGDPPPENDQTASAFREVGIIMMYPSLRGGNQNPGVQEGFFGEVDDVMAAADYLASQDFVNPQRIYLGGHSTGGTLGLLVAECSDRFRAVFSFGPNERVSYYLLDLPFDRFDDRECELRDPIDWLDSIQSPVLVLEGTEDPSNDVSLESLATASRNPNLRIHSVRGANHFSILRPMTKLLAAKILRDEGQQSNIVFTPDELAISGQSE
jgi:pimeloyl-ACP methyl ester carboxylesterase